MQLDLFPSWLYVHGATSTRTYYSPVVGPYPAQRFIQSINSEASTSRIKVNQIAPIVFIILMKQRESIHLV